MNDILIVGMSPGNGYFKQPVIDHILQFCLEKYENIAIFIPDIPAISTYVALGYPENIARGKKAIPQGNNFRNRIQKSILEQKLDSGRIIIFNWQKENIEEKKEYKNAFTFVKDLYINNEEFRKDINSATEAVLMDNPFKKKDITLKEIEIGTHYILSEFAFMMFLPHHLIKFTGFVYGYHNPWPVWEKFIAGEYDNEKKEYLKFLLLPNFS